MSKTLAELRQSPHVGLPERTYSLCLAPKLIGEVRGLVEELQEAEALTAAQQEGDGTAPPRRAGQSAPVGKIRDRLRELHAEMAEHTGVLTLRGLRDTEWRAWVDEHPARKENVRDREVAFGYCNADDLLGDLGRYAKLWNDEEISPASWDWMNSNTAPGDLKEIAQVVVSMHEMAVDVPKLLSSLLETAGAASDSGSPDLSA